MATVVKGVRAMLFVPALALACAGCTNKPTLEEWNAALGDVARTGPAKALPDGSSVSEACVEARNDEPCVPVEILRKPFDQLRVIRPRGQLAQSADRPRLVPYISIRDGRLPRLTIEADYPTSVADTDRHRIAIVLDGDLAYETPSVQTTLRPVLFMPDKAQSQHLKRIGEKTQVQARLYYTRFGDYTEESLPLSPADSSRFASEFRALLRAYDSLYRSLRPQIDMTAIQSGESLYGESDRAGALDWTE